MSIETVKAVMIGHAIGDALGVPVEFSSRDELEKNSVTDMEGFGTYPYPEGTWSDDTSMSLAALDVLKNGEIKWGDIMLNFGAWLYDDKYTATGITFDVGSTCVRAIENYFIGNKKPLECGCTEEHSNGNGSLMRINPFVLYTYFTQNINMEIIHNASMLTHAHERSQIACGIYAFVLWELIKNPAKDSVLKGLGEAEKYYKNSKEYKFNFKKETRKEIKSSGYVVDTLEAAIWCLMNTEGYEECVLAAVNLGEDTDTVAAVAGGLAGALYGYSAIPKKWKDKLKNIEYIEQMCEEADRKWQKRSVG